MYGFQKAEEFKGSNKKFGLNELVKMVKFEWINNAGKGGTEGEALDIAFLINGDERPISYRQFPVTQVKDFKRDKTIMLTSFEAIATKVKAKATLTDEENKDYEVFGKAVMQFNSVMTTIMTCFVSEEELQTALATPISNFKEYCKILVSLLPKNFDQKPLDLFLQYQYNIKEGQEVTFLEVPKNGVFVVPSVEHVGAWKELRDASGLHYVDQVQNKHPFTKTAKWMNMPMAKQQKREAEVDVFAAADTESAASEW